MKNNNVLARKRAPITSEKEKSAKRKEKRAKRDERITKLKDFFKDKTVAAVSILLLAAMDILAMYNLFSTPRFDIVPLEAFFYSFLFAMLLEGLPTLLSHNLGIIMDKNIDEVGRKGKARVGFVVCLFGMLSVFALCIFLRWFLFSLDLVTLKNALPPEIIAECNIPSDGFTLSNIIDIIAQSIIKKTSAKKIAEEMFAHLLLFVEPVLTSIFAFGLSWHAFRPDYVDTLKARITRLSKQSRELNRENKLKSDECERKKRELYNKLLLNPDNISSSWDAFEKEVYAGIKQKLEVECLHAYKTQIKVFNERIEAELQKYLVELSQLSTVPLDITAIKLDDLLLKFDHSDGDNCWSYDKALPSLWADLHAFLHCGLPYINLSNPTPGSPPSGPNSGSAPLPPPTPKTIPNPTQAPAAKTTDDTEEQRNWDKDDTEYHNPNRRKRDCPDD